ncbi:ABC-type sulfate transport system, permease component, partial [Methanophagales archaeon]
MDLSHMLDSNYVYARMRKVLAEIGTEVGLETEVKVFAGPLKIQDTLGDQKEKDYPIQKGKEKLMEAIIFDSRGQAYTDMDPDYIKSKRNGVAIESPSAAPEIGLWCDLIVTTGSIFVNNTYNEILSSGKPIVLYGTTAAGPAHVLGIQRYCPQSLLSNIQSEEIRFAFLLGLLTAIISTLLCLAVSIPTAYAIARYRFFGTRIA